MSLSIHLFPPFSGSCYITSFIGVFFFVCLFVWMGKSIFFFCICRRNGVQLVINALTINQLLHLLRLLGVLVIKSNSFLILIFIYHMNFKGHEINGSHLKPKSMNPLLPHRGGLWDLGMVCLFLIQVYKPPR